MKTPLTDQEKLIRRFDEYLFNVVRGISPEDFLSGKSRITALEKVKEWKSKFGYEFHIYSNDHLIEKKSHFHLIKKSEGIDCRIFFDGEIYDCRSSENPSKKVLKDLKPFLNDNFTQKCLRNFWNMKNPKHSI